MLHRKSLVVLVVALIACCAVPFIVRADTTGPGKFGKALSPKDTYGAAERNTVYFVVPMTVECWAKIGGEGAAEKAATLPTILLSNEPRHSVTHWELVAKQGSGVFAVSLPGYEPAELASGRNIVDGKWHHLGFVFEGNSARLFVDGQEVAKHDLKKVKPYPDSGALTVGRIPGVPSNTEVLIDEVRISRVARSLGTGKAPDAPYHSDADTVALWHFDEEDQAAKTSSFPDSSPTRNAVRLYPVTQDLPDGGGFDASRLVNGRTRWSDMDYGPFFSSTLLVPSQKQNVTYKAISIRLGKEKKYAVAFDTELLRMSVAWKGDFLKITPTREGLAGPPDVAGDVLFGTSPSPGWVVGDDFADPRPDRLGPLPPERGKYRGLYVYGSNVVLSYTIGDCPVLEVPVLGDDGVVSRVIEAGPSKGSLVLRAAERGDGSIGMRLIDPPAGAKLETQRFLGVVLPPLERPAVFKVELRPGPSKVTDTHPLGAIVPSQMIRGGPAHYPEPVTTKGVLGTGDGPYVVDTLTPPVDNPWKSFLRFGGHDFFSNGDCAVCSVSGDVWVVSGIDEKLEQLKWRRFATGLFQPLGLKIVDDKVYVLGRDQITRLHDLNNDGEADFYENFNNDVKVTTNGHAYTTNLETDPQGNFYYTKSGDGTEHGGTVLKVSRDGSKLEVFATGLRNVNGAGAGPHGEITVADNQGEWVPASRIDVVSPGKFLGYQPMSKRNPPPTDPGKPLCWMPQNVDNSSGGQTWVPDDRWGPFKGHMLHTSYGAAALLLVMQEKVEGVDQGGVWRFPFTFDSGAMRARFRKQDGQLYVSGLRGWQTAGAKDACLQRVRYTGKPVYAPTDINVRKNGIKLAFTCPLDKQTASDAGSYSILQWNYHWTAEYGSRQWSVNDPSRQGYDTLEVKSATLLPDGKSVFLEVPNLRPVMQMQIGYDLEAADGTQVRGDVYNTVHSLGKSFNVP